MESDPPRKDLGMIDLRKLPRKEVPALQCMCRNLMVKHSGAHTANLNEPTELVQFLVQRLRDYQDRKDLIPGRPLSRQERKPWF